MVSAVLPLSVLHMFARIWGAVLYVFPTRSRTTTLINLNTCFPEKAKNEIKVLAKQSLKNTACTALEMGKAWALPVDKTIALIGSEYSAGLQRFIAAAKSGQGVILLAPHLSNWEVLGFYIGEIHPTTYLYQPPKIQALDVLSRKARSRSGISMVPTDRKGVAQLLKALQSGEVVAILPDQVPPNESGVYAPFFGQQAFTMTLVSKLVQRTKAKVFSGFAERLPGGKGFKAVIQEASPNIYSDYLEESVAGLNQSVEECVKLAISQYQWEYKRFRRQPSGAKFYKH